jgi:hypothetical protein
MKRYPSWTVILRKIFLALAVLATIAGAAYLEEDWRGERAFLRFEKECADEGKPLDYAFYRPAPIPDAQNMFQAPVLARFFDAKDLDGSAWTAFERGKPLPVEMVKIWVGRWQWGLPADFTAAYAVLKKAPQPKPDPDPKIVAALILDSLKEIKPDLDALRDAARQRPQSQIEFHTDGSFARYSFGALRFFTAALTLRAVAEIELGRNDDAFGDVYALFRFVEGTVTFPSHMDLTIANVMALWSLQPFWEGYERGAWNESQLKTVQDLLSRFHPLRELPVAFAASRAASTLSFDHWGLKVPRWMPSGWWKLNIVNFFRSGAGGDLSSFDPVLERIYLEEIDRAEAFRNTERRSNSPFGWLIRHDAFSTRLPIYSASAQNCFALARTACALERYRLSRGVYPEDLSGLVPAFLESIPRDVIDGAPLRYTRTVDGHFKLYSIGLNGVDDHGALPKRGESWSASKQGDWAWSQPATQ